MSISTPTPFHLAVCASLALALPTLPAAAQEGCPCPPEEEPAPEPLWSAKIGLSYIATTGNSESTTLGSDVRVERRPDPWGLEIFATYDRVEDADEVESERTFGGARAKRALGERWELFGEATGERDQTAGFDLRLVLATGGTYHALTGPRHRLDVDAGLTWTDEDRVEPEPDTSFTGGLLAARYAWAISDRATFGQKATWFPNFEDSDAWRLESVTSLEASLGGPLALRLSYDVRYQNRPVGARDDTDTTTRMSLVVDL